MEGAGLGAGKSKRPNSLLSCRKNEIGREVAEPRRESGPNRLTGLEGNQLVGHNPQKTLQTGFDMAEWWHAVAFNDSREARRYGTEPGDRRFEILHGMEPVHDPV